MHARAPKLLWRYLAADLLKILAVAGLSLVVVIAFAAAMRPLAEGRIEPLDAFRMMGLLAVPMLQFALPFASGLAATLAFHRFAAENEAAAAMAGGISHRSILAPALVIGICLALVLGVLTNAVIPGFLKNAEQLLTRDATRFIINPIERGETVNIGGMDVHADEVVRARTDDAEKLPGGAFDHLVLRRVLAVKSGAPEQFLAADRVDLWLYDNSDGEEDSTDAVLQFSNAIGYWPGSQLDQEGLTTRRLKIPSAFRDDPKYLNLWDLLKLRDHPEMLSRIEWRRRALADRLAERDMIEDIRAQLAKSGKAELTRGREKMVLSASGLQREGSRWKIVPKEDSAPIKLELVLGTGFQRFQEAKEAWIEPRALSESDTGAIASANSPVTPDSGRVALRIDLEHITTFDTEKRVGDAEQDKLWYSGVTTKTDHAQARAAQTTRELLDAAKALDGRSDTVKPIQRAADELSGKVKDLKRETVSKLHERAAFSVSCLLMVLTGSIVALKLRDALPLTVYLWSFFPALACIISISAGQGLTHKIGSPGLILLWGGVAVLATYTAAAFVQLRKH